jgi:beta-phosphoglucomutase family hydrolase
MNMKIVVKIDYAYIFDADGVIVNTMEAHYLCNNIALGEAGVPMDKKQYFSQAGMTGREQIQYFCHKAGKCFNEEQISQIYNRKRELYKLYINSAEKIESNIHLMAVLRAAGIPVAIATGASRQSILPVLDMFGIMVDVIVTADDVKRGKPNPDLFLLAAERLGVLPRNCIVIEDSDAGIEAAKAAGMMAFRFFNNE